MSTSGAPSARWDALAVWDGLKMYVWGGSDANGPIADGGIYNLRSNSWSSMSTTGAPSARSDTTMVYTGSKILIWGGLDANGSTALGDGKMYDIATDTWSAMSTTGAPSPRIDHSAVWDGARMIVWGGGIIGNIWYNDGFAFTP
jgi:N-acetylneuraminic acid mutarotase